MLSFSKEYSAIFKRTFGFTIANILFVNSIVLAVRLIYATVSLIAGGDFVFYVGATILPQFVLFAISIGILGTVLHTAFLSESLLGEIITDWIRLKATWRMGDRKKLALLFLNSYIVLYHLIFPVVIYALIRYRNVKTIALNPDKFGYQFNRRITPGMITFDMVLENEKPGRISRTDCQEHTIRIGDRLYIRNEQSAFYLQLSYSPMDLLHAFGQDRDQMIYFLAETITDDHAGLDEAWATPILKSSFVIV